MKKRQIRSCTFFPGILLGLFLCGCSPAEIPATQKTALIDPEISELKVLLGMRSETPIDQARRIFEQIEKNGDDHERAFSLKKVEGLILATDFSVGKPQKRLSRLRDVEAIHRLYCEALARSHISLEEQILCRFIFWKRLCDERNRAKNSATDEEDDLKRPGLHVPTKFYLDWLDWTCPYHLQQAETYFNVNSSSVPEKAQRRLRQKIENLIGRRIRTDEEILRDWRRRQADSRRNSNPTDTPGPTH